jgi:hypothetical protein
MLKDDPPHSSMFPGLASSAGTPGDRSPLFIFTANKPTAFYNLAQRNLPQLFWNVADPHPDRIQEGLYGPGKEMKLACLSELSGELESSPCVKKSFVEKFEFQEEKNILRFYRETFTFL